MIAATTLLTKPGPIPGSHQIEFNKAEVSVRDLLNYNYIPEDLLLRCYIRFLITQQLDTARNSGVADALLQINVNCLCFSSTPWNDTLRGVEQTTLLLDEMSLDTFINHCLEKLRCDWTKSLAYEILLDGRPAMADLRAFLRKIDPTITLNGFSELQELPLDEILQPEHFLDQTRTIVQHALREFNHFLDYKSALSHVDASNFIRYTGDAPRHYEIQVRPGDTSWAIDRIHSNDFVAVPKLRNLVGSDPNCLRDVKETVNKYGAASSVIKIRLDQDAAVRFIEDNVLTSAHCIARTEVSTTLQLSGVTQYSVQSHKINKWTLPDLRTVAKKMGLRISGKKDELIARIIDHAEWRLYPKVESMLLEYFTGKAYYVVDRTRNTSASLPLPDLNTAAELDDVYAIMTMVFVKTHLRGGALFDVNYEDDSVPLSVYIKNLVQNDAELELVPVGRAAFK